MRAALYARVSRVEQLEGYSIDEQIEAIRRYCKERGWTIVVEFVEPGFTARTDKRPVFSEVLAACKAHAFDVLITHKLDRAFRSLLDQLQRLAQLTEWGVTYVSVVEQIDYSTPVGKMFMSMLGALNQYYSDNLSEEVKKGKRGRVKKGRSNAAHSPYGYKRADGKDVVMLEEAEAVQFLYEHYVTGQYSDQQMADLMKQNEYPVTRNSHAGVWTNSAVRTILRNRFYIGEIKYKGAWYPGEHEAIIDQSLFDLAQAVRLQRGQGRGRYPRTGRVHLLRGIAHCHHCGSRLWVQHDERDGYPRYYFNDSARYYSRDCPAIGKSARQEPINEQVSELVKQLTLPADWRDQLEEIANHKLEQEQVEGRRKYLQEKLRRLRDLYLEGDFEKADYNQRKAEMESELGRLNMPESPDVEKSASALEGIKVAWEKATPSLRHQMLRQVFHAIRIDLLAGRVVAVQPNPEFIPLFRLDGMEERENGVFYII